MTFFEGRFNIRLTEEVENQIARIIVNNPDLYESKSHFIRCAINEKIKREGAKNGAGQREFTIRTNQRLAGSSYCARKSCPIN